MRAVEERDRHASPAGCVAADRALWATVVTAYSSGLSWREGLRAAAYAATRFAAERPEDIVILERLLGGLDEESEPLRRDLVRRYVALIDGGRRESMAANYVGRAQAECTLGLAVTALAGRENGELSVARAAVPTFMYLAVLPYLGEAAAREELAIPPPT